MNPIQIVLIVFIMYVMAVGMGVAMEHARGSAILQICVFVLGATVMGLFVFKIIPIWAWGG